MPIRPARAHPLASWCPSADSSSPQQACSCPSELPGACQDTPVGPPPCKLPEHSILPEFKARCLARAGGLGMLLCPMQAARTEQLTRASLVSPPPMQLQPCRLASVLWVAPPPNCRKANGHCKRQPCDLASALSVSPATSLDTPVGPQPIILTKRNYHPEILRWPLYS